MDEVGERPWDRAFFRDARNLFEKGGVRTIGFLTFGSLQRACQGWFHWRMSIGATWPWGN